MEKDTGGTADDSFYNENWQLLELRRNGEADPVEQYVWDLRYIDAPVVRFRDTNIDGTLDETLFYTDDANMNVTALVDPAGIVQERNGYDAYGKVTFYGENWDTLSSSAKSNSVLYTGSWLDTETGLYNMRTRQTYHPTLGVWGQRDRIGYSDSANLHQYVTSAPVGATDPAGLRLTVIFAQGKATEGPPGDDNKTWIDVWKKGYVIPQQEKVDGALAYLNGNNITNAVFDGWKTQAGVWWNGSKVDWSREKYMETIKREIIELVGQDENTTLAQMKAIQMKYAKVNDQPWDYTIIDGHTEETTIGADKKVLENGKKEYLSKWADTERITLAQAVAQLEDPNTNRFYATCYKNPKDPKFTGIQPLKSYWGTLNKDGKTWKKGDGPACGIFFNAVFVWENELNELGKPVRSNLIRSRDEKFHDKSWVEGFDATPGWPYQAESK